MPPFDSVADSVSTLPPSVSAKPTISINLLRERVANDPDLGERRKRELLTGLKSYARYLNIDLAGGDPTFPANRIKIERFVPASADIGDRRWSNILSDVTFVFRRCGIGVRLRPLPADLDPAWRALRDRIQHNIRLVRGLSALMHYASAHRIAPAEVTDVVLAAFHRYLTEETRETRPNPVFQRICVLWRRAANDIDGWPQQPISLPCFRKVVSFAWSAFAPSLVAEIEEWKGVIGGRRPFDERAPDKAVRATTLATKLEQLRRFLSALVRSGMPIEQITSLAVAVAPQNYAAALTWYLDRDGKMTPGLSEMATTMLAIARHWVKMDELDLVKVERATKKVNCRKKGMTDRNMERLEPLRDKHVQMKLFLLPELLLAQARKIENPEKAAIRAQTGIAIEILLVAPIRLHDLIRLELDLQILFTRPGRQGDARLVLKASKNDQRIAFDLKGETLALLRQYVNKYLPALSVGAVGALFPGKTGPHKCHVSLRGQITKAIRKHCGVDVHPHLFRHFAAAMILKKYPHAYPLVARLLGHKSIQTTMDFYTAFESSSAAEFFYDKILAPRRGSIPGRYDGGRS
jgi:integrase